MIKDIDEPKVQNIGVAAVPENEGEGTETQWYVYLLNLSDIAIENVIVVSRGYDNFGAEKRETSQLRHHLEVLPAQSFVKIEPIMEELFGFTNQYWVSFFLGGGLFDKKYVFPAGSITEDHLTQVTLMNRKGVLII